MKIKPAVTKGIDSAVVVALDSPDFAGRVLEGVCHDCLGATNVLGRPAEYYVQELDQTVRVGNDYGVEVRLTGVSRNGRTPKQFHEALKRLVELYRKQIYDALVSAVSTQRVQLFVVIMIDGDVEVSPDSGQYSNALESDPVWISAC